MVTVNGTTSVSKARSAEDAARGLQWARGIWADMLD
jgi:hypothetical protein